GWPPGLIPRSPAPRRSRPRRPVPVLRTWRHANPHLASQALDRLQPEVAVGGQPLRLHLQRGPGAARDRRPRLEPDRQGRTGGPGPPGPGYLAVDEPGAGPAERPPQVLLLGPFRHEQVTVAQLQVRVVGAEEADHAAPGALGSAGQGLDIVGQSEPGSLPS